MIKQLTVFALALILTAALSIPARAAETPSQPGKQTNLGLYVTAKEAYAMWSADKDKVVVVDVRTPQEYSFVGHAPMAHNIPNLLWTEGFNAQMKDYPLKANPKFIEEAMAKLQPDKTILVMCRSGVRSASAVNALAQAGYKNVYSIVDGFEGDKDTDKNSPNFGKRTVDGWRNSGAPWTYSMDPALVY